MEFFSKTEEHQLVGIGSVISIESVLFSKLIIVGQICESDKTTLRRIK